MAHPSDFMLHLLLLTTVVSLCCGFLATPPPLRRPSLNTSITMVSDTHSVTSIPEFIGWYAAGYVMAKAFLHFFVRAHEKRDE
jgi:hypothetical protein